MAAETLYKLDPRRTIHMAPADLSATATGAIDQTSSSGMRVSGVFRDRKDFARVIFFDADDYFGHPRWKWLPDFDFTGIVWEFDYLGANLQPWESPKYQWEPWDVLEITKADGTLVPLKLTNIATPNTALGIASGTFTFSEGGGGIARYDRVNLTYLGLSWDYIVPLLDCVYGFIAQGAGHNHTLTSNAVTYTYVELVGDSNTAVATGVIAAVNAGAGDPQVLASGNLDPGHSNEVTLTRKLANGAAFTVSSNATGLNSGASFILHQVMLSTVIENIRDQINAVDWVAAGAPVGLGAVKSGNDLIISATVAGYDGNMCTVYSESKNANLTATAMVKLSGGDSDVAWHVLLDFSAQSLTSIRKITLLLAPRLTDSVAYANTEWTATFSGWTVSDPSSHRALAVASPGSQRVGSKSSWVHYAGSGWAEMASNLAYLGYVHWSHTNGNSVTVDYICAATHDLYLGTVLASDCSSLSVSVDGDTPTTLSLVLGEFVQGRRRIRTGMAAGKHTVVLTQTDGNYFYFDYIEAAVPGQVPDAPATVTDVGWSLDFDTDHSYRLPPERLVWQIQRSGLVGRINLYTGLLFYAQRTRTGGSFPALEITFGGTWTEGDSVTLTLGTTECVKTCYFQDTPDTIAAHFAYFVNSVFTAVWAEASGAVVTLHVRSPIDSVSYSLSKSSASGTYSPSGSLTGGTLGQYEIDPTQTPTADLAARRWLADFFAQCQAAGLECVASVALDLAVPPDAWAARYLDGSRADFIIWSPLVGTHCTLSADVLAYQKRVFMDLADMMNTAGLTIRLQLGEFLWWYVQGTYSQGMAFYDAYLTAKALVDLGRALYEFHTVNDDPSVNAYADANWLRSLLRDHIWAIIAHVKATYGSAWFESLWAYYENQPATMRLNRYINWPTEFQAKSGSNLAAIKMEALNFGAFDHDLNKAQLAMDFPLNSPNSWDVADCSYNLPVMTPSCPWERELSLARDRGLKVVLWAWDHYTLKEYSLPLPGVPASAAQVFRRAA